MRHIYKEELEKVGMISGIITAALFSLWEAFHQAQGEAADVFGIIFMTAVYFVGLGLLASCGAGLLSLLIIKIILIIYKKASYWFICISIATVIGALSGILSDNINGAMEGTIAGGIIGVFILLKFK